VNYTENLTHKRILDFTVYIQIHCVHINLANFIDYCNDNFVQDVCKRDIDDLSVKSSNETALR